MHNAKQRNDLTLLLISIQIKFLLVEPDAIVESDLSRTVNSRNPKRGSEGNLPPRKRSKPSGKHLSKTKILDLS